MMPHEKFAIRKVRVVSPHVATYTDALKAKKGELVTCGRRDDEWPGWLWCTNAEGKSGWVPEAFLQIEGERGRMLRDYDATELTIRQGEELQVEEEESGWLLCMSSVGQRGWVPIRNVEEIHNAI